MSNEKPSISEMKPLNLTPKMVNDEERTDEYALSKRAEEIASERTDSIHRQLKSLSA